MTKTILILAANPKDTSRLRLDQEVREIDIGLQRAKRRDEFILIQKWAPRPTDVRRAMLDFEPNIVHFCGHGGGEEGLAFEDETGNSKLVDAEVLAGFFELFADKVECVVLNACYSEVQAEAIAKHINYVVGMNKSIGDDAAIEFAVAFYDALGAGESIEFAHKLACNAIQWTGMHEHLTPILKSKLYTTEEVNSSNAVANIDLSRSSNRSLMASGGKETSRQILLASRFADADVILFVGAGLSMGGGLPGWVDLIRPLVRTTGIRWPTDEADLTTDHLLTAAQQYENLFGRRDLIEHVRNIVGIPGVTPTDIHHLIASLPVKVIFTTNYDNLIERALHQAGKRTNIIISEPELAYWSEARVQVVKLCGDLNRPESIILTKHDFNTYFASRPRLAEHLRTKLETKTALFLGYSLNDPFFNQIWDSIGLDFGHHRKFGYAVLFDVHSLEQADFEQRGIHVISLQTAPDEDRSAALHRWLLQLEQELKTQIG